MFVNILQLIIVYQSHFNCQSFTKSAECQIAPWWFLIKMSIAPWWFLINKTYFIKMALTFIRSFTENDLNNLMVTVEDSSLHTRSANIIRDLHLQHHHHHHHDHDQHHHHLLPLSDQDLHSLPPRPRHETDQEGGPAELVQTAPHDTALLTHPMYHLEL